MLGGMDYAPELRHDFAVTVGGLSGALTGLLFVALSIKSEVLDKSLRSRAAQTLVLFVTSAVTAVVLVAPQPRLGIAVELLVLAAVSGTALFVLDRRAGHDSENSVARYIESASPNMITAVLTGVAGLTLLLQAGGGLYWLIPAVLAGLVGGVINAWLFLLKVPGKAGDLPDGSQNPGEMSTMMGAVKLGVTHDECTRERQSGFTADVPSALAKIAEINVTARFLMIAKGLVRLERVW